MAELEPRCKLCDIKSDGKLQIVDEEIKDICSVLFQNLTFDSEIQNLMCKSCVSKLHEAFSFKSACIRTDVTILPYVNLENPTLVDLKLIYTIEKSTKENNLLDHQEICRLCLQPMGRNHKSINEVPFKCIEIYIPEINLELTASPKICINCHDALWVHSAFVQNCWDVKEKRNTNTIEVESLPLTDVFVKTEDFEIKSEPTGDVDTHFEIVYCIKKEENEEGDLSVHSTEVFLDSDNPEKIGSSAELVPVSHESNQKVHFKTSELKRKNPSPVQKYRYEDCPYKLQIYSCGKCSYKSVSRDSLRSHQLMHKDVFEVDWYVCEKCSFITKRKGSLTHHQLVHKDPSEVQMHKCDNCSFRTKRRSSLKKHQLRHMSASKLRVHECDKCSFKTTHKSSLTNHQLLHKDLSELEMHECDQCNFKTKRKGALKKHQLKHQEPLQL